MSESLRVLDLGMVPAPRSQALFHGIASVMHDGDDPVLTLVSPQQPYVCIGMHQDVVAEVDEAYCRDAGLPVLRRQVGGGAVYLDRNQLFFHFIYPVNKAPRRVTDLYTHFVAPVLATYQAFGIDARLRPINDIHVNDRKIGGTGAAQIGDATIFVGSFMLDFDVETMARCLKVPSEKFRDKLRGTLQDYITTMRRELGSIPPRETLVARFLLDVGEHLRVEPRHDELRDDEIRAVDEWERQLQEPDWLYQPNRRRFAEGVKITGGVHLGEAMHKARGGLVRVRLLSQNQRIADVDISGDFTCIPASGVEALAHALRDLDLASADMTPRIAQHMTTLGLDLPGVDAADIASAIRGACAQGD
ncbi:lipoate--protein ligase family protein [Metallibacterium scheffleri]|nr:biotin/lipoate A/B protein ligase family protein [Metallibacterium scheffleri]